MIVNCFVCDHELDSAQAASVIEDEESSLYFCSEHCRREFDETPEDYLEAGDDDGRVGANARH